MSADSGASQSRPHSSEFRHQFRHERQLCDATLQICNHPLLTYPPDGYDTQMLKQWADPDERLVSESGKMQFLDRLFLKFSRTGHRVLLFSTMTRVLDLMELYFRWRTFDGMRRAILVQ
jgi:SNF2 family DNA or RNA helicase